MAKRIRVTAYYEFDIDEQHETIDWYKDENNEADVFEALQMAHAMGIEGSELHPEIGFLVQQVIGQEGVTTQLLDLRKQVDRG